MTWRLRRSRGIREFLRNGGVVKVWENISFEAPVRA